MNKIIFDFQGIDIPDNLISDLDFLFQEKGIEIKVRKSKNLSGLETLIIAISGRVIGAYIERLIDYLYTNFKNDKIQVSDIDDNETYDLPDDSERLIGKINGNN